MVRHGALLSWRSDKDVTTARCEPLARGRTRLVNGGRRPGPRAVRAVPERWQTTKNRNPVILSARFVLLRPLPQRYKASPLHGSVNRTFPPMSSAAMPITGKSLMGQFAIAVIWLLLTPSRSPRFSFFATSHSLSNSTYLYPSDNPESPGQLPNEIGYSAQQKNRIISIEEPVPPSSVDNEKEQDPLSVTSTSNAALRRGSTARKRAAPPPLEHSTSIRSRHSVRNIPPPLNTATSARSGRAFTLQSMGIIKDTTREDGHRWKEPTVRESLIAIYRSSCAVVPLVVYLSPQFPASLCDKYLALTL